MSGGKNARHRSVRSPVATPAEVANEPAAFPATTVDRPNESVFPDWRRRLLRNLSRRSDSRWEPLTWVHAAQSDGLASPEDERLMHGPTGSDANGNGKRD